MKLFVSHFDQRLFENYLIDYKNKDFSLFVDYRPQKTEDFSSENIFVAQEPNEYFGNHDWIIENKSNFSLILTWSSKILNNCDNAVFLTNGTYWFDFDLLKNDRNKTFSVAHLTGKLKQTYGHLMRHEIYDRQNEIKIPKNFYQTFGDRFDLYNAIRDKEIIFGNQMFGIGIENTSHEGYFSDKITDSILFKTIPIYWGCSNIGDFYDKRGIITFQNADELIKICNNLTPDYYFDRLDVINANYLRAISYRNYEERICSTIKNYLNNSNQI